MQLLAIMIRPTLFFSAIKPAQKKTTVIDLGGYKDSLFRALVVALIDRFMQNPKEHISQAPLSILVAAHSKYFPGAFTLLLQNSLHDSFTQYLSAPALREKLIGQCAFAARQIFVDYVEKNVFPAHEGNKTLLAAMREAHTPIQETYRPFLAEAFDCIIYIQSADKKKNLFSRQKYPLNTEDSQKLKLTLCYSISQDHFYARVEKPEWFKIMRHHHFTQEFGLLAHKKPVEYNLYQGYVHQLTTLLHNKYMAKKDLIHLYIKVFDGKSVQDIAAEHNPFEKPNLSYDEALSLQLIHAISEILSRTKQALEPLLLEEEGLMVCAEWN